MISYYKTIDERLTPIDEIDVNCWVSLTDPTESEISYIVNELLSIVENAGLMGIPIPDAVKNAIEALKTTKEEII